MLSRIFTGKFNYLLLNKENSIIRKLILNRAFNWFFSIRADGLTDPALFDGLGKRNLYDFLIDKQFVDADYVSNRTGHLLIQYAWNDFFVIKITNDCGNIFGIEHNCRKINHSYNKHIHSWIINYKYSRYMILFNYILGIIDSHNDNSELKYISNVFDNYDKEIILKILLFQNIILELDIDVCMDVVDLILNYLFFVMM